MMVVVMMTMMTRHYECRVKLTLMASRAFNPFSLDRIAASATWTLGAASTWAKKQQEVTRVTSAGRATEEASTRTFKRVVVAIRPPSQSWSSSDQCNGSFNH